MHVGDCRRGVVRVRTRTNVNTGCGALEGAAGPTVVHNRDRVVREDDVQHRRMRRGPITVIKGEDAGVLADVENTIIRDLNGCTRAVFRMDVDATARLADAATHDS